MRVVVTGAAGFIGSQLSEGLLHLGHDVVGVDLARCAAGSHPNFAYHQVDLRHDPLRRIFAGADAVVHLAAAVGQLPSWTSFEAYTGCNLVATQRVLKTCREERIGRLLAISGSSVYARTPSATRPCRPARSAA